MHLLNHQHVKILVFSIFLSLAYFAVNASPLSGDSLLAWPISESLYHPEWYGSGDLIIEAGKTTNFLFYKLITHFPWFQDNFPLRDMVIYFPIFCIYGFFWGTFFYRVSKSLSVSLLALSLFIFSDNKLGLHWSYSPTPVLISSTSVQFLQVAAFGLFYFRRYWLAFLIIGLTSFFHPATALSYFATFSSILVLRERFSIRTWITPCLFIIPFLINYMTFLGGGEVDPLNSEHFKIYELFQFHAYIADHFHEGYLYFTAMLGLIYSLKNFYPPEFKKFSLYFFCFSILFSALWLLNVYFIKNTQFLYFYFPMRIFYLIKPFMLFSIVWGLTSYLEKIDSVLLKNTQKFVFLVIIFLFAKCFFRYSSLDSTFVTLALIMFVCLKRLQLSLFFIAAFILSNIFKFNKIIQLSSWGYLSFIFLVALLFFTLKKDETSYA